MWALYTLFIWAWTLYNVLLWYIDSRIKDSSGYGENFGIVYLDIVYFAENWKHYNKIIFKYGNSAVGPIFNEILVKKICLWVSWTVHGIHWKSLSTAYLLVKEVVGPVHSARDPLTNNILALLNKKNKNKRRKMQRQHQKRVSKRILKLGLSCCLSRIKELFIKNKK